MTKAKHTGSMAATRQVHLDFHTSEHIRDVGGEFNRRQFQKALMLGKVDSVTVFAKCHHSWSYYPTKVGRRHPHLRKNLLNEWIEACHDIGVRAPIYYTVGWSANDADANPDWVVRKRDGSIAVTDLNLNAKPEDPRPICSWKYMDPTGGYLKLMLDQTRELCEQFPVDGFFYDICHGPVSLSPARLRVMRGMNLDPDSASDVQEFSTRTWLNFMNQARALIQSAHPQATIFFNGVAGIDSDARYHDQQTHFELEDLPTMWGGYDKFPLRAKYFAGRHPEKPMLAMSGKFHTMWGEFGGFKHADAIRFEAASMISYGAACSFGDQLHPSGKVELATYRNIGDAYKYISKIEQYGLDAKPFSNLAIWPSLTEAAGREHGSPAMSHDQGVATMLLEGHVDFEIVPTQPTLQQLLRYNTLILTGGACLRKPDATLINAFLRRGGRLLALAESILDTAKSESTLFDIGGKIVGVSPFDIDYLHAGKVLGTELVDSPFLNYAAALRVLPGTGKVLANLHEPYFSRTYGRYCSHQNTPNRLTPSKYAGAIRRGGIVYLPHALGKMYYDHGARVHRQFFLNALRLLHSNPVMSVDGLPSAGRANLLHQPRHRRYCIHLTYGPPIQRGRCQVIEDLPFLDGIAVRMRLPEKITDVRLPLKQGKISVTVRNGALSFLVPKWSAHEVITLEY